MEGEFKERRNAANAKPSAREVEIQDMMGTMGLSRAQAMGLVDNTTRLVTDPVTGNSSIVNMATGEADPVRLPDGIRAELEREGLRPDQDAPESSINLFEIAGNTTGLIPAIRANAQKITGQFNLETAPPELRENLQTFKTAQNEVIRALSINDRFPVKEMERIREEVNIQPGAFKDPGTFESQLKSLDRSLRIRLRNEQDAAIDQNLPISERRSALRAAKDINNFLQIMGVPQAERTEDGDQPDAAASDEVQSLINKYLQPEE